MATALLRTKLSIPPPRLSTLPRTHLCQRLDSGLQGKLTLLSAPAGFGKSTLLSAWATQTTLPPGWLTLDERDNDPLRFWRYLDAALHTAFGDDVPWLAVESDLIVDEEEKGEAVVTALLNALAEISAPRAILVLDDYHAITNPTIQAMMERIVENAPPPLHLIIASRIDPPWPLARLRAQGELTELRAPDLRFTPEESAIFLREVMGLTIEPAVVEALEARTEGWIAGLQMAALSMDNQTDSTDFLDGLADNHYFITDYLLEEVLNRQPTARREFLIKSAILDRMNGSLCEAVTGVGDGATMLRELEQANLFIAPLDGGRRWYRYHQLFRELLLARLTNQQPSQVAELHLRASRWYEQHGLLASAMRHATAAGDVERQVALVANNVLHLAYLGELRRLVRWLEFLPKELGAYHPWFHISQAWVLAFAGHLDDVETELAAVDRSLRQLGELEGADGDFVATAHHVRGHAAAIRGYLAGLRSNTDESLRLVHEALALLPNEDRIARGWTTLLLAVELRALNEFQEADDAFVSAIALGRAAGSVPLTTDALWERSWLQLVQGKLQNVLENSAAALELADAHERESGQRLAPTGYAHIGIAAVLHERNELARALDHATEAVRLARRWGMADARARSELQLALTLQALGREGEASAMATRAAETAAGISPAYAQIIDTSLARVHLAQGNLAAIEAWAGENDLGEDPDLSTLPLYRGIVFARLLMAQAATDVGKRRAARRVLRQLQERARAVAANGNLIEILALTALNEAASGQDAAAQTALGEALALGEPQGYMRTFVAGGEPMRKLLVAALAQNIAPPYAARLIDALEDELGNADQHMPSAALTEPLTEREMVVLRLLPTALTTAEIADALVVAPSTVRTHIKRIYDKLDVHRRVEAVAAARELDLLP